jgi:hypothetical protein
MFKSEKGAILFSLFTTSLFSIFPTLSFSAYTSQRIVLISAQE